MCVCTCVCVCVCVCVFCMSIHSTLYIPHTAHVLYIIVTCMYEHDGIYDMKQQYDLTRNIRIQAYNIYICICIYGSFNYKVPQ